MSDIGDAKSAVTVQRPTVGGVLKYLLRISLIAYLMVVLVLTFLQRNMLYHPLQERSMPVAAYPKVMELYPDAEDITIRCADGVTIGGWLLRDHTTVTRELGTDRPLVIFLHGNAGNRAGRLNWYQLLHTSGADVLAIDYHGYGDSGGKMSEGSMQLDCDAAWDFATDKLGYQPSDIVVVGASLGGAAAVYLAARQCEAGVPPAALILVATFSSMVDVGSSLYRWLPVRAVLVDRYPSDERIEKVTCPIVILHGDQDRLVQQRFGEKLYEVAPESAADGTPKKWINLPGIGHNDILSGGGPIVLEAIERIIQSVHRPESANAQ